MMKHSKASKELLHPREFGKHPLRLPPPYLWPESYAEIFNMIEFLEIEILTEMKVCLKNLCFRVIVKSLIFNFEERKSSPAIDCGKKIQSIDEKVKTLGQITELLSRKVANNLE